MNTKPLFKKRCIKYELQRQHFQFHFQLSKSREEPSKLYAKRNLVDSCTTGVIVKIAQIVGRHLNKQRSVLKCLVHQIALKGILVEAIYRTRHRHLTSTRHPADFSCQLQHLKTHIRNTKYDLHCFFLPHSNLSRAKSGLSSSKSRRNSKTILHAQFP